MVGGWSGGGLLEHDLLAGQPFEFGDELAFAAQRGEPVVPVGAKVGEPGIGVSEQVPGDDQDGVADRDQGALLAAAPGDPLVAGGQEGLGAGGAGGGFADGAAEPGVAGAGAGGFAPSGDPGG